MKRMSKRPPATRTLWAALIAAILSAGLLAAGALARGGVPPHPTKTKGVLTVAIELGNPGFAEGTLARPHGFDVDTATAVARRMGLRVRFVHYPLARLFVPTPKPYDVAFEFVTILPGRARFVDFSAPYFSSTQGVLVAKDITAPVTLALLRKLQICAKEVSTGSSFVHDVLQPDGLVLEYPTAAAALDGLSRSICDAFVFDLPSLIAAKQAQPGRYGALAGRVGSTEQYGAVLRNESPLRPAINNAIMSLRRDGTIRRIAVRNFGPALASAPIVR
jgi:polar amino acid transport system substrate-binding protein